MDHEAGGPIFRQHHPECRSGRLYMMTACHHQIVVYGVPCPALDEQPVIAEAQAAAVKLWGRFPRRSESLAACAIMESRPFFTVRSFL
jgi:hypothetical protein